MRNEELNRAECTAMRGIAIMAIMLHNYCHWLQGVVRENEYTWTASKCQQLIDHFSPSSFLLPPSSFLPPPSSLLDLFSFFGHYGVPVFLFLSGFGLVKKYERSPVAPETTGAKISLWRFLRYNYLKLFRILIIGFVLFVAIDAVTPVRHHYHLIDVVAVLGMFGNLLDDPSHVIWPGPYWYFGLTMQLYLLYWVVFRRWRHWSVVVVAIALCWLWQELYLDDAVTLERLRYNFVGGMLPFGVGMLVGRGLTSFLRPFGSKRPSAERLLPPSSFLVSIALVIALSFSQQTWLWVPLFMVTGTIALVRILPKQLLRICEWLGGLSAVIFVVHPAMRELFVRFYMRYDQWAGLLLYVVATLVVSWALMQLIRKIPKPQL